MGWASGGEIFDRVAHALVKRDDVPDAAVTAICADLADALRDGGWDTVDDSVQKFRNHPAVLAGLEQADPDAVAGMKTYWAEHAERGDLEHDDDEEDDDDGSG